MNITPISTVKLMLSIFLYTLSLSVFSQSWIDKDENQNYTARHEYSFVQAGDKFIMFGGRESAQRLDMYDYTNDS